MGSALKLPSKANQFLGGSFAPDGSPHLAKASPRTNAPPLRFQREDGPPERAADLVPNEAPADAAGLLGRSDNGDVPGREERLQAASIATRAHCGKLTRQLVLIFVIEELARGGYIFVPRGGINGR